MNIEEKIRDYLFELIINSNIEDWYNDWQIKIKNVTIDIYDKNDIFFKATIFTNDSCEIENYEVYFKKLWSIKNEYKLISKKYNEIITYIKEKEKQDNLFVTYNLLPIKNT